MTRIERIRVLKAMQTTTLQHKATITGMIAEHTFIPDSLKGQLEDCETTADNHVAALEHVITQLSNVESE
jgi:hypothetical protein